MTTSNQQPGTNGEPSRRTIRMRRSKNCTIAAAVFALYASVCAQAGQTKTPAEHVVAPGGKTVYYIMSITGKDTAGSSNRDIEVGRNGNTSFEVLLKPKPSSDPKQNLDDFSHLFLSPDGKTLYFQASAWATSDAIHSLDIATKRVSFVTPGEIACVVLQGEHQGDLIVEQHRYFVQGGSHDDLYLYDPAGKEIGLVMQGADASGVCPSLSN